MERAADRIPQGKIPHKNRIGEKMINLSEFHSYVTDNQSNICQMTVIQNGKTILNDVWNSYKAEDTVHTMSVTKSIVSLLVGIAIEQGLIGSVDD